MKNRILSIMKNNNLSATKFADKIGVPRSGLSHVLKGRNKASLDYVLKILEHFPDIDSMWLLTGEISSNSPKEMPSEIEDNKEIHNKISSLNKNFAKSRGDILKEVLPKSNDFINEEDTPKYSPKTSSSSKVSNIDKIVFFYSDGSFKEYNNTPIK